MLKQFLLAALISLSANAYAQPQFPISVSPPLTKTFPGSKIIEGDLNGDGVGDFVVLMSEKTIDGLVDRVTIYEGKLDGTYGFAVKSASLEYGTIDIEMKRKSLYIWAIHNSLKESINEIYQFKYRNGNYLLISKQEKFYSPEEGNEYTVSENYLTGKRIEKQKINKKTKEISSLVNSKEPKLLRLDQFSR